MRWLENTLLILGLASLCALGCGVALTAFGLVTIFANQPGQQPSMNWGAAIGAMFTLACGGIVGAVVGIGFAIALIKQRDDRPWSLITWLGILAGVLVGLACIWTANVTDGFARYQLVQDAFQFFPSAFVLLCSLGTITGGIAQLFQLTPPAPRKRKRSESK